MTPTMFKRMFRSAAAAAILGMGSAAWAAQADSAKVWEVLKDARLHAVQAAIQADQLESYSMSGFPWQTHYYRLLTTGDEVNALVKDLKQLQGLRAEASPKQQEVIDRFGTLVAGLASNVSNTRKYLVRNQDEVSMPTFHNQVRANYAAIAQVSGALCNCVKAENDRMVAANVNSSKHSGKNIGPDCPSMTTR